MRVISAIACLFLLDNMSAQYISQEGAWANNPNFMLEYKQDVVMVSCITGIKFLDVSVPASPSVITTVNTTSYPYSIKLSGNYLYAGGGMGYFLDVIDVTNLYAPMKIGTVAGMNGTNYQMDIKGNYVFVTSNVDTMFIVDVASKTNPFIAMKFPLGVFSSGIAIRGNYAYVGTNNGVLVIDVTNPLAPTLVNTYGTGSFQKMSLDNVNARLFAAKSAGFEIIDISNPSSPSQIYAGGSSAGGSLVYYNGYVYQTGASADVYKITGNSATLLCNYVGSGQVNDIVAKDSLFFLSTVNDVYALQFHSTNVGFGIETSAFESGLTIAPNPVVESLAISARNQVLLDAAVSDVAGRYVKSFIFTASSAKIDVSALRAGIYYLEVRTDAGFFRSKFVKTEAN